MAGVDDGEVRRECSCCSSGQYEKILEDMLKVAAVAFDSSKFFGPPTRLTPIRCCDWCPPPCRRRLTSTREASCKLISLEKESLPANEIVLGMALVVLLLIAVAAARGEGAEAAGTESFMCVLVVDEGMVPLVS